MSSGYFVFSRPEFEGITEMVRGGVGSSTGGHPAHWHSQWQLVAVTRGDGWVRTRGTQHGTPAGSLFLIPPETVHSNDVFERGCDFRSMLIEPHLVEGVASAASMRLLRNEISKSPVLLSQRMANAFDHFHATAENNPTPLGTDAGLENWITSLLTRHTGQCEATPLQIAHPAARKAKDFIADRATDGITLENVAVASGLSRYELSRQFKAAFGMPPHAWQLQVRIDRSKPLLRKGHQVGEVALQMGFSDQAHFTRVFKRTTGYTPGTYAAEFRTNVQADLPTR